MPGGYLRTNYRKSVLTAVTVRNWSGSASVWLANNAFTGYMFLSAQSLLQGRSCGASGASLFIFVGEATAIALEATGGVSIAGL